MGIFVIFCIIFFCHCIFDYTRMGVVCVCMCRETLNIHQKVVIEIPMKNITYKYVDVDTTLYIHSRTRACMNKCTYSATTTNTSTGTVTVTATSSTAATPAVTSSCNKKKYIQKHNIIKLKIDSCVYCRGVFDIIIVHNKINIKKKY